MKCRICGNTDLKEVLSLGKTALANSFLSKTELSNKEDKFPLEICFCNNCKLIALTYVVPAEMMFKNYVYVTSTTNTFRIHFSKMAEDITRAFGLDEKSVAVDIGSNDGLLLKGFQKFGVKVVGVEPATNIARMAQEDGVPTINEFFERKSVEKILEMVGNADVVTANNVFAHVNDITDLTRNVKMLLKPEGIFVIEVQYFVDTLEKMTFDNIYHEHLSYFTLVPLINFFRMHGMEVFKVERVDSHGGSLRAYVKKNEGKHKIDSSVAKALEYEKKASMNDFITYKNFAHKVYDTKNKLVSYIKAIKKEGKKIAGYGAPAKGNTLLNFCGIGHEHVEYVVDDNPLKIGLYTPGTHIPVVASSKLDDNIPDYLLILAWNFAPEILQKTKKYADKGVKFIIPLPEPVIV